MRKRGVKLTPIQPEVAMIAEIIFSDFLRTVLLCALSVGVVFSMRNASIRKKAYALAGYELIVLYIFLWIFIVSAVFTEGHYESIISIAKWGLKWIFYFTISTIVQCMIYCLLWKKNKILKAVTVLLSAAIMCLGLSFAACSSEKPNQIKEAKMIEKPAEQMASTGEPESEEDIVESEVEG